MIGNSLMVFDTSIKSTNNMHATSKDVSNIP